MSLWESEDAAQATGGNNTLSWSATGVSIDTRTIQPGDLFIALKADRDGHEFVKNAFDIPRRDSIQIASRGVK